MILIFPFAMRESINYAIRARLRGEYIIGASSEDCQYKEYCDEFIILPSIFDENFKEEISKVKAERFYTPHHLVYNHVKSLALPFEFAEGSPIEIMQEEFKAAQKTGISPDLIIQSSRIYGHMSEEKLCGMVKCFDIAPKGSALEIGHAWGKSLKVMTMLADDLVYAMDTCDAKIAEQEDSHQIIKDSIPLIDWKMMGDICRANVPEAAYFKPIGKISVLHIDGNHDYPCVKRDFEQYENILISNGWLILDDIDWSGVSQLWEEIKHKFADSYIAGGALFARKI